MIPDNENPTPEASNIQFNTYPWLYGYIHKVRVRADTHTSRETQLALYVFR